MKYKNQSINLSELFVNLENPRFDLVENQQKAFDIMLRKMKSKIKNLAHDIVNYGLNPGKPLLVLKGGQGKYIVLEGNRRLIAIKLILNPNTIKLDDKTKKFFQELKKEASNKNLPKKLNCVVFSNKEDVSHWIELEHTGENKGVGQVPWDAEQTARFK